MVVGSRLNNSQIRVSLKPHDGLNHVIIRGEYEGDPPKEYNYWGFMKIANKIHEDTLVELTDEEVDMLTQLLLNNPRSVYLTIIKVNEARRRQGVAGKALSEMYKILTHKGYNKVYALTDEETLHTMERLSFIKIGERLSNELYLMEREF